MSHDEFITVLEASRMLRVSTRTIRRLVKQRALPYNRVGRQIRLLAADLRRVTNQPALASPSSYGYGQPIPDDQRVPSSGEVVHG